MASSSKRKRRQQNRRAKRQRQQLRTAAILSLVGVAAAAAVFWPRQPAPQVSAARLEENPFLGPSDARVTLTEFGDLACSACRSWHQAGILLQIMRQFQGQLRYEWRDFPVITADSPRAAEAGQCAHDQGRFWDYLDHVYSQPGSSYANVREPDLRRYAAEVGLDTEAFDSCLASGMHRATVQFDLDFAYRQGFQGTPSFAVNGTPIVGANPQLLIQAIERELPGN